jgi:hypothetical protein
MIIDDSLTAELKINLKDRIVFVPPDGIVPVVPVLEPVFLKLDAGDGDATLEAFAAEHVLPFGGHLVVGHGVGLEVEAAGDATAGRVREALEDGVGDAFFAWGRGFVPWHWGRRGIARRWGGSSTGSGAGAGSGSRGGAAGPAAGGAAAGAGPMTVAVHLQADDQVGGLGHLRRFVGAQKLA